MFKSVVIFIASAIATTALIFGIYEIFSSHASYIDATRFASYAQFDFAAYTFGIVAVAVSLAGVYVSVVPERCSEQLLKLLKLHLTPDPFQDLGELEKKLHPSEVAVGFFRTEGLKCTYAIVVLSRWVSISKEDKDKYLGHEGISSARTWFGPAYRFLQIQTDRLFVATVAINISIIYVLLPVAYLERSERLAVAMLLSMYILCVTELVICAMFYLFRNNFVGIFEERMSGWRGEIQNHLLTAQARNVPTLGA